MSSTPRRTVGLVALALGAFLVTARLGAWLGGPVPYPEHLWHAKLDALVEREAVDTVFVGSSLVHRHVDPAALDRRTAELGAPTHSFNLGMPGMSPLELDWISSRLVAHHPPGLRTVCLSPPRLLIDAEPDATVQRTVNLHDAERLVRALELVAASDLPARRKLAVGWSHAVVTLRNALRVGTDYERLRRRLAGTADDRARERERLAEERAEALGPLGDGFDPLVEAGDDPLLARRAAMWARSGRRDFARGLREARAGAGDDGDVPPGLAPLLARVERRLAAAGWEVVFFTHPLVLPDLPDAQYVQRWTPPGGSPVLDFTDPARHPELFDPDLHFDLQHLNARGAELFTRRLAEALAAARAVR